MGKTTGIQWADATWNPWIGCRKVAVGCQNCYMYRDSARYGFDPTVVRRSKTRFNAPLKWKDPKRIFVCSYSDFWIPEADEWRDEAFKVILEADHHTYMIPTKRAERMDKWDTERIVDEMQFFDLDMSDMFSHIQWGISVSTQTDLDSNIKYLIGMPGKKFLSIEPMLEPINIDVRLNVKNKINGVIVGCESGPDRSPFDNEWAIDLYHQCMDLKIAYFYKQGIQDGKFVKLPEIYGHSRTELI
ncbi:DUF5131 family protein [Candidatus Pacearchaeota archaeon]|nr:DUF5131 family protein [Candidatus Pacearchaeota archaeon]